MKPERNRSKNLLFGRQPLMEALRAGFGVIGITIQDGARGDIIAQIRQLAEQLGIPVRTEGQRFFDRLAPGKNHQGVLAEYRSEAFDYTEPEALLEYAAVKNEKPVLAILDQITDPHNFGAIIRSAVAAGLHGLIIPKHNAAEVTDTVMKTSAGTAASCGIARVTNIVQTMEWLKKNDVWIYGSSAAAEKSIYESDFRGGTAVVIGSEGKGMRRLVEEHCDFLMRIPLRGPAESLNASVAAGVIFFEINRQRSVDHQ